MGGKQPNQQGMQTKKPCVSCNRAYSKRERTLGYVLVALLFAAATYRLCHTAYNYNRYELYPWVNAEAPIIYKLDKRTGKVTAINQLWEFETEPYTDPDDQAKHWAFPNRQSFSLESNLLHQDWQWHD